LKQVAVSDRRRSLTAAAAIGGAPDVGRQIDVREVSSMDAINTRVEQARQLAEDAGERREDAVACAEIGRYCPACVMAGASVEAALLAQMYVFEPELRARSFLADKDTSPSTLNFDRLIQMAIKMEWLPSVMAQLPNDRITEALGGKVGDAVRFIQYMRNVTGHPGKRVGEVPWLEIGKVETDLMLGIADAVFEHLYKALEELESVDTA